MHLDTTAKDVELCVQLDQAPTTAAHLARGSTSSGNETISVTPTSSGTSHVLVHGYEGPDFTLRTADN